MVLHELLGLPEREKHVVSLCGGGGKTTLMYALARETKTILPTALFTTPRGTPPPKTGRREQRPHRTAS